MRAESASPSLEAASPAAGPNLETAPQDRTEMKDKAGTRARRASSSSVRGALEALDEDDARVTSSG